MWAQIMMLCIFVGIVCGWFSSTLIGHGYGYARDILVGVLGALIGGICFQFHDGAGPLAGLQRAIGNAFLGSLVLLISVRFFHIAQHRRRLSTNQRHA